VERAAISMRKTEKGRLGIEKSNHCFGCDPIEGKHVRW
jgi:hypothetical protein